MSTNPVNAMKLLFFAYANKDDDRLEFLLEEYLQVDNILNKRGYVDVHFTMKSYPFATTDYISSFLIQNKENLFLFHFSGHAGLNRLELEDSSAQAEGIAQLLKACPHLKLVVLNGCSTADQVELLLEAGIPVVIATYAPVHDQSAYCFARGFYQALEQGGTIEEAFESGLGTAQLKKGNIKARRGIDLMKKDNGNELWGLFYYEKNAHVLKEKLPEVSQPEAVPAIKIPSAIIQHWCRWSEDKLEQIDAGDLLRNAIVASPLESEWNSFVDAPSWRQDIQEKMSTYSTLVEEEKMPFMPPPPDIEGKSYPQVRENLQEWLQTVETKLEENKIRPEPNEAEWPDNPKKSYKYLKRQLARIEDFLYPEKTILSLAFLVTGAQGSGKTQFFKSRKCDAVNALLLPLDQWLSGKELGQQILDRAREAANGHDWNSPDDLNQFLKAQNLKLIVMIDDIHRVFDEPGGSKKVVDFIAAHSKYDSFKYLFAIQDTYASLLADYQQDWKLFSCFQRHKPDYRTFTENIIQLSGWVDLKSLNDQRHIGHEILEKAGQDRVVQILQMRKVDPSPLEAQLLLEIMRTNKDIEAIASFNFFRFLTEFFDILAKRSNLNEDEGSLKTAVAAVAKAMVLEKSLSPSFTSVKKCLSETGEEAKVLLQILKRSSLVVERKIEKGSSAFFDAPEYYIQINYPFIWKAFLARELWEKFGLTERESEAVEWLGRVGSKEFQEGIWEFLLLLADDAVNERLIDKQRGKELWTLAFSMPPKIPFSAPCFSARWASSFSQKNVAAEVQDYLRKTDKAFDLFALLYFLIESPDLSSNQRFKILRPFYELVGNSGLGFYLEYGAERIFRKIGEITHLENCLSMLSMSHLSGCQERLAELAWDRYIELKKRGQEAPSSILNALMEGYLKYDGPNALEEKENPRYENNRRRRHFRQELLKEMFYWLFYDITSPRKVFEILHSLGWFDPQSRDINRLIAFEMRMESNLAFGRYFRKLLNRNLMDHESWAKDRLEEYKKLVMDLIEGRIQGISKERQQDLGYFMLRHTDFTGGKTAHIHKMLWDAVDMIDQNPYFRQFLGKYPIIKQGLETK